MRDSVLQRSALCGPRWSSYHPTGQFADAPMGKCAGVFYLLFYLLTHLRGDLLTVQLGGIR